MENGYRLIDANEALRIAKEERYMWVYDLTDLEEFLTEVPTVDAVEVVRCKDCKHLEITGCYGECRKLVRIVKPWDFCSYGERRNDV